jgi:hypothetical protein
MLEELEHNILLCVLSITDETLHWVASKMRRRERACMAEVVDITST